MKKIILCGIVTLISSSLLADSLTVDLKSVDESGVGQSKGKLEIVETPRGLVFSFNVAMLGGEHGFNIHSNASCNVVTSELDQIIPAFDAGDIYTINLSNPKNRNTFPALLVDSSNLSKRTFLVDKIKSLEPLMGKSIVIRLGGEDSSFEEITQHGDSRAVLCGTLDSANIKKSTEGEKKTLEPIKATFMNDLKKANANEAVIQEDDKASSTDQLDANKTSVEDSTLESTTDMANAGIAQDVDNDNTATMPANTTTNTNVEQGSTTTLPTNTTTNTNTNVSDSAKNAKTNTNVEQGSTTTLPTNTTINTNTNASDSTTNTMSSTTK